MSAARDRRARRPSPARTLPGEKLGTEHWRDARHWIAIYDGLIAFKHEVLARVPEELSALDPDARGPAAIDTVFIQTQLDGYIVRLGLWHQRLWDLQGLWIDPSTLTIRHEGKMVVLTPREYQFLRFLIAHPRRSFTSEQIIGQAWVDHGLHPALVRNYVVRIRRILDGLGIPYAIVNRPSQGYSLERRVVEHAGPAVHARAGQVS